MDLRSHDRPAGSEAASAVWFAYSPDRKGEHPAGHLKDYRGVLQADGYAGFKQLYEKGGIVEAACWAHVRRKFHDLYQAHQSPVAKEALERIAQLYGIEKGIRGRSPAERREVRRARSIPLLESMHAWLKATMAKLSRKSDVAVAIHYATERWTALTLFTEDGRVEMDNNAAERALRVVALGRKNYLFAGSDAGGDSLNSFRAQVIWRWYRALRRRSQRDKMSWERFWPLVDRWIPSAKILHPHPNARFDATHPR